MMYLKMKKQGEKMKKETIKICPICNKHYTGESATSRKDNKTKICSGCGITEAMMAFMNYRSS